jgi:hypothetical protein
VGKLVQTATPKIYKGRDDNIKIDLREMERWVHVAGFGSTGAETSNSVAQKLRNGTVSHYKPIRYAK